MHSKNLKYFLAAILLLVLASPYVSSQNPRRSRRQRARENTEVNVQLDSLMLHQRDSVARADSLHRADSLALLGKSSLTAPAFSSAGDSIVELFKDGKRLIYYYGGVTVEHQNMKLTADYMEYDMNTGIVFARGTYDSLAGEWKGRPVMEQGKDKYEMEELRYNFNTRKARITNMTTNDDQGILHGENLKMFPDKSINITKGRYTVCDDEHPHYYLRMTNAAVITKPTQKTVFGPSFLVLEDVTLPIGLPFGFIPEKPERATGMLMPSFGEENARGFYMRDAGIYFVIGDYFDISLTGDVYSLGSWAVDLNSRYKVNYKFTGNFSMTYSNDQTGEKGTPDFNQSRNFGVKWSHSQDAKARPGTTFSASVNFSSPSNNRYNSRSVSEALQNQASSSISYSHNWNGKVNLSINGLHSQNSRDSSYTFTLPNVTLSVSTFYPFKQKNRVGSEKIYEKISFGYTTSLQNKISFKASEFNQPGFYDKFQNGMNHNFSIGLPNFTLFKYFNINPGVTYGMNWFFRATEYSYDEANHKLVADKGKAFSSFGVTQTYSGSVSMSTRIYGMLNFGKGSYVQALRHVISPSVSLSLSPELGTAANGWRTIVYTDPNGEEKEYSYNRYAGQLYGAPGKGRNASMSFSVGNNFEAKVRDKTDTTGVATKKVKLIDQLNLNSSYNFLADSLNLANLGVTTSTTLFDKVNVSANANFDPYAINERGQRINTFNIVKRGLLHPVRMTNASVSLSYNLQGEGATTGNDGTEGKGAANAYQRIYYHPVTGEYIPGGWLYYMNSSAPWTLSFNYSFSFSRSYQYANNELSNKDSFTQTLGVNGNIKLTPKMAINFSSGFDFVAMKMTTTQVSATYDLHCFNIAVSWIPTGQWQSYSFRIAANASALADLLRFKKSTSYWDNQ